MKKIIGLLAVLLIITSVLTGCAKNGTDGEKENNDFPLKGEEIPQPMAVMVDDVLYYDSGQKVTYIRCGVMDGDITSTVENYQLPQENGQSNFGTGYSWQLVDEHHIDIPIQAEGGWSRFCDRQCEDDHSYDLSGTELKQFVGHTVLIDENGEEVYYYNDGDEVKFYDGTETEK